MLSNLKQENKDLFESDTGVGLVFSSDICVVLSHNTLWGYDLAELCLHSRKDHDDGHHSSQQQKEGEHQPCDSGVVGRGTASTQKAWGWATQAGGLGVV